MVGLPTISIIFFHRRCYTVDNYSKKEYNAFSVEEPKMDDYQKVTERQRKWLRNVLLIMISGTLFTLGNRIWLGLLLGCITSYANLLLLQRQVDQMGYVAIGNKGHATAGTIFRIGSALLVVSLVRFFELEVNIYALVIGFMFKYVVILLESLVPRWEG